MSASTRSVVPPPAWPAGGLGDERLRSELLTWISSNPVQDLADACGWRWPESTSPTGFADALADLTDDWDFRGDRRERGEITGGTLHVNGRVVPDETVLQAAHSLGLVAADHHPVSGGTGVTLVLGAAVRGIYNRSHHALRLLQDRPDEHLTVLTAARPLTAAEMGQAHDLDLSRSGLPGRPITLEVDAVAAVLRRLRPDLDAPAITGTLPPPVEAHDPDTARRREHSDRIAAAYLTWPGITVVLAPSGDPDRRRTNTGDQLRFWAAHAGPGPDTVVTAITTQIYVPYQQIAAVHAIGRSHRCGIRVIGVDADTSAIPTKHFAARDYLQEVRSTILAARSLLTELG